MDISKIRQIVEWVSSANLAQFELHNAGFSIRLTRPAAAPLATLVPQAATASRPPAEPAVRVAATALVCGRFLSTHPLRDQPEVRPGDTLEAGMLVGLIAVGELLLPVTATVAGTMGAFMVEDQQLVGYGTPLVALANPACGAEHEN